MKLVTKIPTVKNPNIKIDKSLNKYDHANLFPEKLSMVNESLAKIGMPKPELLKQFIISYLILNIKKSLSDLKAAFLFRYLLMFEVSSNVLQFHLQPHA